jgi:anti-sigma-K factor RskA
MTSGPIPSDDIHIRAGEYVLGTLDAGERAEIEGLIPRDPALAAAVRDWEARLAPLNALASPVEPSARVWSGIERSLDALAAGAARNLAPAGVASNVVAMPDRAAVDRLRRSVRLWQAATGAAAALAAGLALFIGAGGAGRSAEEYVAVVNRGGDLPALIVRVDTRAGEVRVRSLAAEAPPDRSLELWYIGAGGTPRSIGLVQDARQPLAIPADARTGPLEGATLAVSVEPPGGSPTGSPTGPVVYSGRLIRDAR